MPSRKSTADVPVVAPGFWEKPKRKRRKPKGSAPYKKRFKPDGAPRPPNKAEKRAHHLYELILKMVYKILGKGMTLSSDLVTTAVALLFPTNKIPQNMEVDYFPRDNVLEAASTPGYGFYFLNTDIAGEPGSHHMLLYKSNRYLWFYDSFGRKWKDMVPELKALAKQGFNIRNIDNSDREQKITAEDCGQRRSEEHTLNSSHVRISYAVFCLKK